MSTSHAVRRTLFTIHMWVGLILGILLAALGLSGSLLVYDDRIADLIAPAPRATTAGDPLPLSMIQDIAGRAAEAGGAHGQMQIVLPDEPGRAISVRMGGLSPMGNMPGMGNGNGQHREGGRRRRRDGGDAQAGGGEGPRGNQLQIFIDPVSGEVLGTRKALLPPILTFAHQLHGNFMIGRDGRSWIVGPLGVAMLVLGVTGLVLWWPRRGQWKYAFFVRRTATGLRFHRELHAATGIWIFVVFMAVSFSGVVIAWPQAFGMPQQGGRGAGPVVEEQDGKIIGATEAAIAALKALPGAQLRSITIPARPGQAINVQLLSHGAINATVTLNPYTGAVMQVRDPSTSWVAWQRPVHQGNLNPVWKFLVFLSGLVPALFVTTGLIMWAKKRKRRVPMTMLSEDVEGEAA
jgi:uncharacterized iron-regulated membrane protein